jgi:RNA polymerase sigma-70 factor (ECF subfamily)
MSAPTLRALFLPAVGEEGLRQKLSADAGLEGTLRDTLASARARFPQIHVPEEQFLPFLAARLAARVAAQHPLTQAAELYLCCACLLHDPHALSLFESQYIPVLRQALSRVRLDSESASELLQDLRLRLLVGGASGRPKLTEYGGSGSLLNWLRVVAVNAALNSRRSSPRELPIAFGELSSELPLSAVITDSDPELEHLRSHYNGTVREALTAALAEMKEGERTLLRLSILDGLSVDELGRLLRVHRATAARRVAAAREQLLLNTKRQLAKRAHLRDDEVTSVLRALVCNLEVSISGLL